MPWSPAVPMFPAVPPPALAAAAAGSRMKKRAGLPKLLHKLFIKVLRLKPVEQEEDPSAAFAAAYYGAYGTGMASDEEEYCYLYSYGGAGSSWAGVLSSIPEEEDDSSDDDGDVAPSPAVLRKVKSERFVVRPPDAATVVHVEVLL